MINFTTKIILIVTLLFAFSSNSALASEVSGNLDSNASINAAQNNTGGSGSSGGSSSGGGGSISNSNKPINQNVIVPPTPEKPNDNSGGTIPPSNNVSDSTNTDSLLGSKPDDLNTGTSSSDTTFVATNLAQSQDNNSQTAAASDAFSWLDGMNYLWILLILLIILIVVITYKYLRDKNEKNY